MKDKNAWNNYSPEELKALENLNKGYIDFISEGKTERRVHGATSQDGGSSWISQPK